MAFPAKIVKNEEKWRGSLSHPVPAFRNASLNTCSRKGSVIKEATVFEFLIRDQSSGNFVIAPRKATLEAIQLIGGRLLPRSAEIVDESRLDENGFLTAP